MSRANAAARRGRPSCALSRIASRRALSPRPRTGRWRTRQPDARVEGISRLGVRRALQAGRVPNPEVDHREFRGVAVDRPQHAFQRASTFTRSGAGSTALSTRITFACRNEGSAQISGVCVQERKREARDQRADADHHRTCAQCVAEGERHQVFAAAWPTIAMLRLCMNYRRRARSAGASAASMPGGNATAADGAFGAPSRSRIEAAETAVSARG
jgi:hypothetical protein